MGPTTPPPQDDELLERLRALGPVLDDLTRDAAGTDALGTVDTRLRSVDRQPSGRAPNRRRVLAAAAAILLLVAGAIGIVALTSDDGGVVRTNRPDTTTSTEPDAAIEARVAQRIDQLKSCGPLPSRDQVPVPWPKGWEMVGSPTCDTAFIEDPGSSTEPVPVYVEPEVTKPVAYWSAATGWIDATEFDDPTFDLERYREAYQAELQAHDDAGGN